MNTVHTVHSFDAALQSIAQDIERMGGVLLDQISLFESLVADKDLRKAHELIQKDLRIDELQLKLENEIPEIIALRQPVAQDLRQMMAYFGAASDIERIGDHLKNSTRRLLELWERGYSELPADFQKMYGLVASAIRQTVTALSSCDVEVARKVWQGDERIDEYYDRLLKELDASITRDAEYAGAYIGLLFIAKALERIGDHATNMSEAIVYWGSGQRINTIRS